MTASHDRFETHSGTGSSKRHRSFQKRILDTSEALPVATVFALATAGLRVRMTRSLVTTTSVVLAIAFLSYSGLTNLLTRNLANRLGEMEHEITTDGDALARAVTTLHEADLFSEMSPDDLRRLGRDLDMGRIHGEELAFSRVSELVRASRIELAQSREELAEQRQALATLSPKAAERARIEEVMPRLEARVTSLEKRLQEAEPREAELAETLRLGRWITGHGTDQEDTMFALLRNAFEQRRVALFSRAANPSSLTDRALIHLGLLLTLAEQHGYGPSATIARKVWVQEQRKRHAASLRMRMRRAGVDPQRALAGNPLDTWLIVMALLTCAVGIANAMLMSVTERIREIGTMKCLGAEDGLVIRIFLIESALVGATGAVIGIVLGFFVALIAGLVQFGTDGAGAFPQWQAWPVIAWSVAAGFFLAVAGAVGPAWQASRMRPVDALRVDE